MNKDQLTEAIIEYVTSNLTTLDENADNPYVIDVSDKTIITTPSVYVRIEDGDETVKVVVRSGKYANKPDTALHMELTKQIDGTKIIASAIDYLRQHVFTNLNIDRYCDDNSRSIDELADSMNNDEFTKMVKDRREGYIADRVVKHKQHVRALIKTIGRYHKYDVDVDKETTKVKTLVDTIARDPYAKHFEYDISQDVDNNVYGHKVSSIAKLLRLTADNATADNASDYSFNMRYHGANGPRIVDKAEEILNKLADEVKEQKEKLL